MKHLECLCLMAVLLPALAGPSPFAAEKDRTLTLMFVPQESTGTSSPALEGNVTGRPLAISFEDGRSLSDKAVVGDGTGDDDEIFAWRATNDAGAFAREVFLQVASGWGVRFQQDAELRLHVRLVRFFVSERDQAVGSMYAAESRMAFMLTTSSGGIVAEVLGVGDARRYGRKRSPQNCNEVLSDSIKEAYANGLSDSRFQSAWLGKPPAVDAADGMTPAELLVELVKLKAEGFSPELLADYVSRKHLSAPFSPDELVRWKEAGMEEAVIRAAIARAPAEK